MPTGINVPIRIGGVTVMPGDLVVGDREGVYFIPPQFVKEVLDRADEIRIHDEWTKKKFAKGNTNPAKFTALPKTPNYSRSIGNTSSAVCRKFAVSAPIPGNHRNKFDLGLCGAAPACDGQQEK